MKNKYGHNLPPPPKPFVPIESMREPPPEFTPEKIQAQIAEFLKKPGAKIKQIPIGESGLSMTTSVSLGIKSNGNKKERDTIAPKRGYLIPDSL